VFPAGYLFSDAERSIAAPADGDGVIAVGAYCNATTFTDDAGRRFHGLVDAEDSMTYRGKIYSTTQRGGLYRSTWKPTLVAPGIGVAVAVPLGKSPDIDAARALATTNRSLDGSLHRIGAGTSFASPIVVGAVALFMQKHPDAPADDIRRALEETSFADGETGDVPNDRVGHGKLDLFRFLCWGDDPSGHVSSR
jgi:subtilisin family serine protease